MPRTEEQLEHIRKEKKKLILDVALELFATNGFHATSISQITKKAGISKGLVYNYFESKNDILEEISHQAFDNIYSQFDLNHDGILSRDEFITFIRNTLRSTSENRQFWKLYYALIFQPHMLESFTRKYAGKGHEFGRLMREFIESQGSCDPDGDLLAISSLIKGTALVLVTSPDFFPLADFEEKTIAACFRLISHQPDKTN
ncbi:TetR/AcrR family transcriptional regulator [Gaoshiqia sediminis]|uniref:TetR/AcrR family transcriptional regulator n=1 Tax=Gaoshiqia sediminis TaxID=2986998 RepID=A0AA41Y6F5_9BACT|nr:TetR/AcrR family transcriptional regulator [Gaoshiqia sediminis]MCW0484296.1 TetR/AcrR family transcriptional regulator [Gaoshiqia sediminis]